MKKKPNKLKNKLKNPFPKIVLLKKNKNSPNYHI